ncbi:tRNA glutamyl-Q(34) synthetase GluQRS [Microbaculum marinisediminis]|uniref:tRNA glutamyl-Q(34) synthetase GluQRS n=1 Tax=Microbaculum marinisediminis TaxID=2931392 RepID=A0AAW5R7A2_9HYPH|nr:tRNA glutamyl-Q(34) synthetase GluQRS [Microbaculum sp. A6E488]MCT8974548.1 tRNA glutamyl-Q(34) synthetase GluQRS [Microbaculum sp. A6E488]
MSPPVLRFAPSPTGALHLGHALSALLTHDAARARGGRFLLRIEDIDRTRCRPAFEQGIQDDLAWLGLAWERPVRRQSDNFADYRAAARELANLGLLYPCTCTRAEIAGTVAALEETEGPWPRDPDGTPLYPGTCRPHEPVRPDIGLAEAGHHALRLDMRRAAALAGSLSWIEHGDAFYDRASAPVEHIVAEPARWGDVVICRKETPTSYHLSVTVDDALQGITHVTRGRDLYDATAIHRLLQTLLGLPAPNYAHHRLLMNDDGHKLSKTRGDTGLAALRDAGRTPADIRRMVGL